MKVFIKNKLISIGGSSEVYNENQEQIYKIKGKFFTLTKKKRMYDMQGNLLYTIRNKYWRLASDYVYVYDAEGDRVATIKKGRWGFKDDYQIIDTEDEMMIDGRIFGFESYIMKNGQRAGKITRNISIIKDAFTLEADEKEIPFFTALVIAFDNMVDKREKDKLK